MCLSCSRKVWANWDQIHYWLASRTTGRPLIHGLSTTTLELFSKHEVFLSLFFEYKRGICQRYFYHFNFLMHGRVRFQWRIWPSLRSGHPASFWRPWRAQGHGHALWLHWRYLGRPWHWYGRRWVKNHLIFKGRVNLITKSTIVNCALLLVYNIHVLVKSNKTMFVSNW